MQDNVQGWDSLTAGGVDVHMISGEHTRMLEEPNVAELAERLERCLRAAESPPWARVHATRPEPFGEERGFRPPLSEV